MRRSSLHRSSRVKSLRRRSVPRVESHLCKPPRNRLRLEIISKGTGLMSSPEVADRDARYTKEAFWFVRDGVHQAVQSRAGGSRHVTAHELLETLRILALERYGTNAREQLRSWGVTRCEDFGEIVFALIDNGVFGKRPEDRKEDFENGYDFETAFPSTTSEA